MYKSLSRKPSRVKDNIFIINDPYMFVGAELRLEMLLEESIMIIEIGVH